MCASKVRLVDFATHAQALTERVRQAAQKAAAAAGRPYHFLRSSQTSKEAANEPSVIAHGHQAAEEHAA